VIPENAGTRVRDVFAHPPHWITFTSSSTVRNFVSIAGREALDGVKIASVGPVTSQTLREHGLKADVEANPHTMAGLVDAILRSE